MNRELKGGRPHWENSLQICQSLKACNLDIFLAWCSGLYRVKLQEICKWRTSLNATR